MRLSIIVIIIIILMIIIIITSIIIIMSKLDLCEGYMDRYLMFYAHSTAKGHIRAKQNVFQQQVKSLLLLLLLI